MVYRGDYLKTCNIAITSCRSVAIYQPLFNIFIYSVYNYITVTLTHCRFTCTLFHSI